MKADNDYSMYKYLKDRDMGDDREQIAYYTTHMTSDKVMGEIDKLADCLYTLGVREGDSVSVCLPNIPNAIIAFYAVNKLGAAVNLIHPLVPPQGLYDMTAEVGSKVVFLFDAFYARHREVLDRMGAQCILCSAGDYLTSALRLGYRLMTYNVTRGIKYGGRVLRYAELMSGSYPHTDGIEHYTGIGERIAAYIHSGGTTGEPKTAMLSNRAINECSYNVRTLIGDKVPPGESMLMVLPLFHIFGLGVCMHTTLTAGGRCILVPRFTPRGTVRLICREKPNYMTGVPNMYKKMMRVRGFGGRYLKNMKCCYCGGDKLPQDIKSEFDSIMIKYGSPCRLSEGYGLTEAGICTVNSPEIARDNSVGVPLGDAKVAIFDSDGNSVPVGGRGEICISGDNIMSGYYQDRDTTAQVMFTDGDGVTWVRTGDCGYIEESGHLYYVDRIKRMIKVSGINVFPAEIERIVTDNVKEIANACAIETVIEGKSAIKLLVTVRDGYCFGADIEKEIREVISDRLMKYSLPKVIKCVDSLPLTEIGKVDYKKITAEEKIYEDQ